MSNEVISLSIELTYDFNFYLSGNKDDESDTWYTSVNLCESSPVGWADEELVFFEYEIEANTKEEAISKLKEDICSELEKWIKLVKEGGK